VGGYRIRPYDDTQTVGRDALGAPQWLRGSYWSGTPAPTKMTDIPNIIGKYKAGITRAVGNALMRSENNTIWQRSYHDHMIRNETDDRRMWQYIDENPARWQEDCYYIGE